MTVEVQLRTIAIDCWASLEHQIKYKRRVPHEHLVREELKRYADEIASVDLSMETIRELLNRGLSPRQKEPPARKPFLAGGVGYGTVWAKAAGGRDAPPHRESWPGRAFLARKLFWAPWVMESPRPEVAQRQGGGGVVVPVVLPGLLWGFCWRSSICGR